MDQEAVCRSSPDCPAGSQEAWRPSVSLPRRSPKPNAKGNRMRAVFAELISAALMAEALIGCGSNTEPQKTVAGQRGSSAKTQAAEANRTRAQTCCYRGIACAEKGDLDGAIVDFTEAIRLDPECARAYQGRALACAKKGEFDKVIADCTEAIRLDPNDAEGYRGRALANREKGNLDGAVADYSEAIRLNPNRAAYYYGRGVVYTKKGDFDKAIADNSEAIRLDPGYAQAYYGRGVLYAEKGDTDKANKDFDQAKQLGLKPQ